MYSTAITHSSRGAHHAALDIFIYLYFAGIVKAVDVTRGVFYISTPVPQEQLKQVDILLQGRVEIPVPLLMVRLM